MPAIALVLHTPVSCSETTDNCNKGQPRSSRTQVENSEEKLRKIKCQDQNKQGNGSKSWWCQRQYCGAVEVWRWNFLNQIWINISRMFTDRYWFSDTSFERKVLSAFLLQFCFHIVKILWSRGQDLLIVSAALRFASCFWNIAHDSPRRSPRFWGKSVSKRKEVWKKFNVLRKQRSTNRYLKSSQKINQRLVVVGNLIFQNFWFWLNHQSRVVDCSQRFCDFHPVQPSSAKCQLSRYS